ncbi:hypothetical protein OROMI_027924 [Orobanche minor]
MSRSTGLQTQFQSIWRSVGRSKVIGGLKMSKPAKSVRSQESGQESGVAEKSGAAEAEYFSDVHSDSKLRQLATGGILIRKMRIIYRWKAMEVSFPTPPESYQSELRGESYRRNSLLCAEAAIFRKTDSFPVLRF